MLISGLNLEPNVLFILVYFYGVSAVTLFGFNALCFFVHIFTTTRGRQLGWIGVLCGLRISTTIDVAIYSLFSTII